MQIKISCVYIILNKVNGKFYLGSTVDFNKRSCVHLNSLRKGKHHSIILQRAYEKYGDKNFDIFIYQFCLPSETTDLENYYMNLMKPYYNVAKDAVALMRGRKHSVDSKIKMSKAHLGNKYSLGHKQTELQRANTAIRQTGTKRDIETKMKMRVTAIKQERYKDLLPSIEKQMRKVIDSNGTTFKSMSECAKFWNISVQTVCDILKGRHNKTRAGITFKYLVDL